MHHGSAIATWLKLSIFTIQYNSYFLEKTENYMKIIKCKNYSIREVATDMQINYKWTNENYRSGTLNQTNKKVFFLIPNFDAFCPESIIDVK